MRTCNGGDKFFGPNGEELHLCLVSNCLITTCPECGGVEIRGVVNEIQKYALPGYIWKEKELPIEIYKYRKIML